MSKTSDMTPDEMRAIIDEVYGRRQQRRLAADIDRSEVTVCRWVQGDVPIGGLEALLMRLLLVLSRHGVPWRKWVEEYEKTPSGADEQATSIEDLL